MSAGPLTPEERLARVIAVSQGAMSGEAGWRFLRDYQRQKYIEVARVALRWFEGPRNTVPREGGMACPSCGWAWGEHDDGCGVDERIADALAVALKYGQTDGNDHKLWVIDRVVRILAGNDYDSVIAEYRNGEDGPETYTWEMGKAP